MGGRRKGKEIGALTCGARMVVREREGRGDGLARVDWAKKNGSGMWEERGKRDWVEEIRPEGIFQIFFRI